MHIKFGEDSVLTICPDDSVEAMALRYWEKEYEEHGPKMLMVKTKVPSVSEDKE